MKDANFLNGGDKDLVGDIYPILSYKNKLIYETGLRMDTGGENVNEVSTVRLINNLNYVNKNYRLYNGTGYNDVQVDPTNVKKPLSEVSNGM